MADLNQLTHKVQEALQQAGGIATRRNHQGIDVEHLLLALLDQPDGLAGALLEATGVAPRVVREAAERELARRPQVRSAAGGPSQTFLTQRLSQLLTRAEDEMRGRKDDYLRKSIPLASASPRVAIHSSSLRDFTPTMPSTIHCSSVTIWTFTCVTR